GRRPAYAGRPGRPSGSGRAPAACPSPACRGPALPPAVAAVRAAPFCDVGRPALVAGDDVDLVDLHLAFQRRRGGPGRQAVPARLALVTVLQFVEGLPDRRAADAVRGRIDWKYALGLELTDPGFDHTVLSEFRTRLVAGEAASLLLDTLLARVRELKLLRPRG